MSDLENAVKPFLSWMILDRGTLTLNSNDQGLLALWTLKTVMMLQQAQSPEKLLPREHHAHLYEARTPHHDYRISVGRRDRDMAWPYRYSALVFELARDGSPIPTPYDSEMNGCHAVVCIGHYVAHAYGRFYADDPGEVALPSGLDASFIRIWPTAGRVVWPPQTPVLKGLLDGTFGTPARPGES